jgi:hypothetical protein
MSNFKVGQKVVFVGSDINHDDSCTTPEINSIQEISSIEWNYIWNHWAIKLKGFEYANDGEGQHFVENELRPLSYTSNTNFEIMSLFAPTEERQDVIVEPKKVEA